MVSGDTIRPGDTVRDQKLGRIWTVVGYDDDGNVRIECKGVIALASFWDLQRCDAPSPDAPSPAAAET